MNLSHAFGAVSFSAFLIILLASCTTELETVDFLITRKEASPTIDSDTAREGFHFQAFVGETLVFKDVSSPEDAVEKRFWQFFWLPSGMDTTITSISLNPGGDGATVDFPISEPGTYRVILCINEENSAGIPDASSFLPPHCTEQLIAVDDPIPVDTAMVAPVTQPPPVAIKPNPKPIIPGGRGGGKPIPPKPPKYDKSGLAGAENSTFKSNDECVETSGSSFTAALTAAQPARLKSFVLFTDKCGGMTLSLSGGGENGIDESYKIPLTAGRNQVVFEDELYLNPGVSYKMSCSAFGDYSGCSQGTPSFLEAGSCKDVRKHASKAIKIDQGDKLIIFDLKFDY